MTDMMYLEQIPPLDSPLRMGGWGLQDESGMNSFALMSGVTLCLGPRLNAEQNKGVCGKD